MVSIFEYTNYRKYLERWIESHGDGAYGLKGKIAKAMGISSSLMSQIQKGERSLTSEQTFDLANFIGLNELEADFFHLIVEFDKSGNHRYKDRLQRKIKSMQEQSKKIGTRVPRTRELSDEQKAIFYSSWLYSGITNLSALNSFNDAQVIADHLKIEARSVQKIIRFLLEIGMCKEVDGKIKNGTTAIHVDRESPFVNKHHQNWRIKAISQMENSSDSDVFFTSPMSLSVEASDEVKKMIVNFIQSVMSISGPSQSEKVSCLNIDWFDY